MAYKRVLLISSCYVSSAMARVIQERSEEKFEYMYLTRENEIDDVIRFYLQPENLKASRNAYFCGDDALVFAVFGYLWGKPVFIVEGERVVPFESWLNEELKNKLLVYQILARPEMQFLTRGLKQDNLNWLNRMVG